MNRDQTTYYKLGKCQGFLKMIEAMSLEKIRKEAKLLLIEITGDLPND